ncbi:MAG: hypothetical protein WKF30_15685 [Pyrinomonadaceae bacterium]
MATLEQLIEEARSLSPDEQRQLREALEREARLARIREVQAKYAHMKTSSENFIQRKAEEIELEDRRFRRRES